MTSKPRAFAAMVRYINDRLIRKGMRLLLRLGLAPTAFALLETTGRRTGLARHTPVGNGLIDGTFWLIVARGDDAHYVQNLRENPAGQIKIGRRRLPAPRKYFRDSNKAEIARRSHRPRSGRSAPWW
jgi:deazaflavin-dependent oxidoreductase (nitroreductase family)